jgi:hypothetical protein
VLLENGESVSQRNLFTSGICGLTVLLSHPQWQPPATGAARCREGLELPRTAWDLLGTPPTSQPSPLQQPYFMVTLPLTSTPSPPSSSNSSLLSIITPPNEISRAEHSRSGQISIEKHAEFSSCNLHTL